MTPTEFVIAMKDRVRNDVSSTVEYLAHPPVPNPPAHLGEFSRWWSGLCEADREMAVSLLGYVAEGSLFAILNVLDDVDSLDRGHLELFHVDGDARLRLNDPEQGFLYDLFNNTP